MTLPNQSETRAERLQHLGEINKEIIRLFLQLDNVDLALNEVLAMAGTTMEASRSYVFRFREEEGLLDNTHEWCAYGVEPQIDSLRGLPFSELVPSFFPMLLEQGIIAPEHIDELPDDVRAILEPQGIQTVMILPLYTDRRLEGFVGFDETRSSRQWLPEEITTGRIIAESYARALEREQNQRELIRARDEALRTAELRSQFVANMSHEIRTPMTGTMGMLELLLETDLDELQREFATEAYNSSARLLTIINEILDFSKLDAGKIVLEAKAIDLRAIAAEVRATLAPQVKSKDIRFDLILDHRLPHRVYGDATRLRQVLMNLASNAVKFTHEGDVTLSMVCRRSTDESIAIIDFNMRDTGIGISEKQRETIFQSFVQADGGITRKFGGSGLGLSISQQLVGLMGGELRVDSAEGIGSEFYFTLRLPIARQSSMETGTDEQFGNLQALLVDNNRTARYVLAQQLESWGVTVLQADDLAGWAKWPDAADLLFIRTTIAHRSIQQLAEGRESFKQIILISEPDETLPRRLLTYPTMYWPIDQSSLYNLLTRTMVTAPPSQELAPADAMGAVIGRVLVADDNPINVDLIVSVLERINVAYHVVENGQEVLDSLDERAFDLILMDIQMPIMGGLEATRHIRASGQDYATIPIIALTASVMRDETARYTDAGIDEVIGKPFSVRKLGERIQAWLQNPVKRSNDA